MSVPNELGLPGTIPTLWTGRAPAGTPPPASLAGDYVGSYVPAASTGQVQDESQISIVSVLDVLSPMFVNSDTTEQQLLGEYVLNDADIADEGFAASVIILAEQPSGNPTQGQEPTPTPTIFFTSGNASTGQQPAVNDPFTDSMWWST